MAKHRAAYHRNYDAQGEWSSVIEEYEGLVDDYEAEVDRLHDKLAAMGERIDSLIEERDAHTPLDDEFWRGLDYALMVVDP